jgi:hypothetical protein
VDRRNRRIVTRTHVSTQLSKVGAVCGSSARTDQMRGADSAGRPYRDHHWKIVDVRFCPPDRGGGAYNTRAAHPSSQLQMGIPLERHWIFGATSITSPWVLMPTGILGRFSPELSVGAPRFEAQ